MKLTQLLVGFLLTTIITQSIAFEIEPITNWNTYPIPQEVASISRGGLTKDKVAITDGVGAILLYSTSSNTNETNNASFNNLLSKNRNLLDTTNPSLNELIVNNVITVPNTTLNEINNNIFIKSSGYYCEDGLLLENENCYTTSLCSEGVSNGNGKCIIDNLKFSKIDIAINTTCGIANNNLYCWGRTSGNDNSTIPLNFKLSTKNVLEVSASSSGAFCIIDELKNFYCQNMSGYSVPTGVKFKSLSFGNNYQYRGIYAIDDLGDVYGSGWFYSGVLGNFQKVNTSVKFLKISTGIGSETDRISSVCGLSVDQDIYCWGYNGNSNLGTNNASITIDVPTIVSGNLKFIDVVSNCYGHCGITTDNDVYCWGYHMDTNNTIGYKSMSKISGTLKFKQIVKKDSYITCGLTLSNELYCQKNGIFQKITPILFDTISGGGNGNNICGIEKDTKNGFCMGDNSYGQLGNGTQNSNYLNFTPISGITVNEGCVLPYLKDGNRCYKPALIK